MAFIDFDVSPADETLGILSSGVRGCLFQMKATVDNALSIVWQNPYGLTPQEVFDVLDTHGETWAGLMQKLKTTYNSVAPSNHDIGDLVPADKTLTFDGTGKGTVGDA